jgi:hypothetical protein
VNIQPGQATSSPQQNYDKKIKKNRFQNFQRDVLFSPYFRGLRDGSRTEKLKGTSVTTITHIYPPSLAYSKKYDRFIVEKSTPRENHLVAYRTPAEWRDLTDWMKIYYYQCAASHEGTSYSFTLNLSPEIEAKARKQKSAAAWLLKRIKYELRKLLPSEDQMLAFVLEQKNAKERLHLHGVIVTADPVKVRAAMRLAAGEWERVRQHQAHTHASPDEGWAGYIMKDNALNKNGCFSSLRGFKGEPMACTRELGALAKDIYSRDRRVTLQLLKLEGFGVVH